MQNKTKIQWPKNYSWMHDYLMQKPGAVFEHKASWNAFLYRLHGKIFALLLFHSNGEPLVNVKCEPFLSLEFKEACPDVRAGWHMNKFHWLSLHLNGKIPREMAEELLDISYDLILEGLPVRLRDSLTAPAKENEK